MKLVELKTLKKCREEKNYNYKYMADMLSVSKSFYWQMENGQRRLSYDNALKIANIFNTTTDNLFNEDFKKII